MAEIDFEQAYDEHAWWVLGYMANRVGRADAEELTQLTFERAFASWERFDPARGTMGGWLFTIARNLLRDHLRASAAPHRRAVSLQDHDPPERSVPGPEHDLGLDPLLAAALQSLSQRDREIVALRFGGQLTGPQIAKLTGLSLANVQQIISRSLRQMRAQLQAARAAAAPAASTGQPSGSATGQPSSATTGQPSGSATGQPSSATTGQPSAPTTQPSSATTGQPSGSATGQPSSATTGAQEDSGPSPASASAANASSSSPHSA
ncbi:MAG: RNA polymerase sigma factor [Solirubrobacteraceae bacterium]